MSVLLFYNQTNLKGLHYEKNKKGDLISPMAGLLQ